MKVLVLYEYPPTPGGLSMQGDLLHRGLSELGVDVHAVHIESAQEKEWYYRWFKPDVVVGVGYWGDQRAVLGVDQGFESQRRIVFPQPRAADYRASVHNIADHLLTLMNDSSLRVRLGKAGRQRVKENYDYRVVARRFVEETEKALGRFDQ